jgi:CheY-like chemotaxis protein
MERRASVSSRATAMTSSTSSRCEILLVEDDLSLRRLYVRQLVKEGLMVNVAETAAEAIALLDGHEYDVLVLDWFLPNSHGGEVLSFLKRATKRCARKVVVVTSAEPTALANVDRNIVNAVLFKPLTADALSAFIMEECRNGE